MRTSSIQKTLRIVQLALLIALVVALQMLSAIIPPIGGTVSITLTLIPVVIGGILLGKRAGAILGFFFGLIVLINCINGLDIGGSILWNENPLFTAIICFVKGIAAGFFSAFFYELICGKNKKASGRKRFVATVVAAISAPIINTGLFVCGMFLFFSGTLHTWADGENVIIYIIVGLAGFNFLVEFLVNTILSPAILRITEVVEKKL